MKIYALTAIGRNIASNPSRDNTIGYRILAFLRRHNGAASDTQIMSVTGASSLDLQKLEKSPAVRVLTG